MKTFWYALMDDELDSDWGSGTFDKSEAIRMMSEINGGYEAEGFGRDCYIAVIDCNYEWTDDKGFVATTSGVCVDKIRDWR